MKVLITGGAGQIAYALIPLLLSGNIFGDNMKQSKLIAVKLIPNFLPVSLPTVRSWIFQQKVPVIRFGRKVFVREEVLEKI